jgi:hypothetical protein
MDELNRLLKKLDRPPAAQNFVRLVTDHPITTGRNIVTLATSTLYWNYRAAYGFARAAIEDGLIESDAVKALRRMSLKLGLEHNEGLLKAFYNYERERKYSILNPVQFESGFFRVSRDIKVPVTPLTVVREKTGFLSVFLCGWSDLKELTPLRRRLFMTIVEDAFLSLTDYMDGPAEFLFFPKRRIESTETGLIETRRTPEIWKRGDYDLISQKDMSELIDVYLKGRELAKLELHDLAAKGELFKGKKPVIREPTDESKHPKLI